MANTHLWDTVCPRESRRKSTEPGGGSWALSRKSWAETTETISLQTRAIIPPPDTSAWRSVSAGEVGGGRWEVLPHGLTAELCSQESALAGDGRGALAVPLLFSLLLRHPWRNHLVALLATMGTGAVPLPAWFFWSVLTQARHELREIPAPHLEGWGPFLWAAAHPALRQISTALGSSYRGRDTRGSKCKFQDVILLY